MSVIKDIYSFPIDSKVFNEYFLRRKRNEHEQEKLDELTDMIMGFYQKEFGDTTGKSCHDLFNYDFSGLGYCDPRGYYAIHHDYLNYYYVLCYGKDINDAFRGINCDVVSFQSDRYEEENRKEFKKDFKARYPKVKYVPKLYKLKFAFEKWKDYYDGELPEEIIDLYQFDMQYLSARINDDWSWIFGDDKELVESKTKIKKKSKI